MNSLPSTASEAFEHHDRANANVYMSEVIALPDSLSARQRRKAVRRYCQTFDRRGLGYTVAMHLPDPNGDGRNYHCHIIYSLRSVTRLGAYDWSLAASKVADVNTPDGIRARRGLAVAAINATLKASGSAQRYTDASNRARGLGPPSPKQGQKQTWALRRAAVVEARSAALARLQAATSTLRAGLAVLARAGTARGDIRSRLRGMQEYNASALADSDQRMAAVRIRVRDGLSREPTLETAAEPGGRITVAKSNVVDALAGAMAGFTSPDAFAARIAAIADARARRKARRQADAEALTAAADKFAAAPPPDLEPYRTVVVERLSESYTDLLRRLPDLTPTCAAVYGRLGVDVARIGAAYDADRQRIINLTPVRRPDDRKPVDSEAGRKSVLAAPKPAARTSPDDASSTRLGLPTAAMVSEDLPSRVTGTPVTPPAPSSGTEGQDPALIAANREDAARRRRIAPARETARAATLAPAAASPPLPIPPESHDDDLAVLQAAKARQDAKKGR